METLVILGFVVFLWWLFEGESEQENPERWPLAKPGELVAGDQVQLLSGGPVMTVAEVGTGCQQGEVWCWYHDELNPHLVKHVYCAQILRVKPSTRVIA